MQHTYLSTAQLSKKLPYSERTIRDDLKDSVLIEGIHYVRPFGRRKIFYIWEAIEKDLLNGFKPTLQTPACSKLGIPMANGGRCNV